MEPGIERYSTERKYKLQNLFISDCGRCSPKAIPTTIRSELELEQENKGRGGGFVADLQLCQKLIWRTHLFKAK